MKKVYRLAVPAILALVLGACDQRDADIVSHNLSVAADSFEVTRRIVFYNGITGEYMLTVEGLCSLGNYDSAGQLSVTCKTGATTFKKHFLGLSDNVTYFVEQVDANAADPYRYRVVFKPLSIIPDIDIQK